jgi:hypothetical protein
MPGDRNLPINQLYPPEAFYHNGQGGRVLDVTKPPFNARGDGVTDDTKALCAAMRFVAESYDPLMGEGWSYCGCKLNKSWILYLPDGEYLVSDTIDQGWPERVWHPFDGWSQIRRSTLASPEDAERRKGERWHAENYLIRLVGQNRTKTVIRLKDNCAGFGSGQAKPVVAFCHKTFSNVNQGNYFENITIVTGSGNPGAVALKWNAANWGGIRNALLCSGDGQGRAGLMMDVGCVEGYLRDITVQGFGTGIDLDADGATVVVLEHATVAGQSGVGVRVGRHHDCLATRKLRFENVPVALKADNGSHVVLLESRASGREGAVAALSMAEHGHLFVRDFECVGFTAAVAGPGDAPLVATRIDEFVSDPPVTPDSDVTAKSLRLPVRDMPVILPEPDLTKWADVQAFGAKGDGITDDTAAIQQALNSGKPVVFFPRVAYVVNGSVSIPASVREICFLHGNVYRSVQNLETAMFRVSEPSSEPLLLHQNVNAGGIFVDHEADRPLVLEDVHTWFHHVRDYARAPGMLFPGAAAQTADIWQLYRNTRPGGAAKEVFAANVMGFAVGGKEARHAVENVRAWVRQLNNEHIPYAQVALRRSDLWLLGFKVENAELLFHADHGTRLEVLGGIYHNFSKWDRGSMIQSRDSQVTAWFVLWSGGSHQPDVLEAVAGEETTRIPIWQFPLIDRKTPAAHDTRAGTFVVSLFSDPRGQGTGLEPRATRAEEVRQQIAWDRLDGCAHIRGFNYQPSWASSGVAIWLDTFDAKRFRFELERGKQLFPSFNCVRLWLSWSAYGKHPEQFLANLGSALGICHDLELLVIPVLFTRWDGNPSFDPVTTVHLRSADFTKIAGAYLDAVVGRHRANPDILAWDLCNEPLSQKPEQLHTAEGRAEREWLQFVHARVKQLAPSAKTCLGTLFDYGWGQLDEPFCDLLTPHIYLAGTTAEQMDAAVRKYKEDLRQRGVTKPVLATETCWGSLDDMKRKEIIRTSLTVLRRHGIGFLPHALYTSPVADLHPPEMGPVAAPGYMGFIRLDGSIRPGHEVYNEFCP